VSAQPNVRKRLSLKSIAPSRDFAVGIERSGAEFKTSPLLVAAGLISAYFLGGKLGLHFATVNPSATAIWAPTGISLAACLFFGSWVWPAIFAGAFLVNVTTFGSVATSLAIAAGNTLEALTAAYLVRRFAPSCDSQPNSALEDCPVGRELQAGEPRCRSVALPRDIKVRDARGPARVRSSALWRPLHARCAGEERWPGDRAQARRPDELRSELPCPDATLLGWVRRLEVARNYPNMLLTLESSALRRGVND
jgi:MASE1